MGRVAVGVVSALAGCVFLVAFARLGSVERAELRRSDVALEGDVPATLYLPGGSTDWGGFWDAPPADERPPGVVMAHGFAGDRVALSSLARRVAKAGYAVLALDLAGHGANRHPYRRSRAAADSFRDEMAAAVDFLRASPHVDGGRVAVMGQSMGAGAALDYGTRDSALDAVIAMSGGWSLMGPFRPPNTLFLYAEFDPQRIRERSQLLAARLAGAERIEPGRTYGDASRGEAVRVAVVPEANHASLAWSDVAVRELLDWLDAAFGRTRAAAELPGDPRMGLLVWIGAALLLTLPGLGLLVGRAAPAAEPLAPDGRGLGLVAIALALLLTAPLLALGAPAAIVSLEVADVLVSYLALAGIALLLVLALRREVAFSSLAGELARALPAAAVAMVGVYLMLMPLGVFLHRLALTPERMLAFALATAGLLPFSLAVALLLRRGPPLSAALHALAGRAVLLAVLLLGIRSGLLASVLAFIVGPLFAILLLVELLAASLYWVSYNRLVIAWVDAASLALVLAAIMPIRI